MEARPVPIRSPFRRAGAGLFLVSTLTLLMTQPACVAHRGPTSWTLGFQATERLTLGGFWANYFTVQGSGDVLAAFTVQGGTVDIFLMTYDQYVNVVKRGDADYEWLHRVPRKLAAKSPGGQVFAPVTSGRWAIVYFNAAESQRHGEDVSVWVNSQIHYRVPSQELGSGTTTVTYRPGSMCPSCLSATCHRVHPMCSKCKGRGIAWSEVMKAETRCNFCQGTGRSDY